MGPMPATPPPEIPSATASAATDTTNAPKESVGEGQRVISRGHVVTIVATLVMVALLALTARACESFQGGPVRSAAELSRHVTTTQQTGEDVYAQLSPSPLGAPWAEKGASTSCVDDFGFDDIGETRDQPVYTWEVDFTDRRDYLTAVKRLRADWKEQGRTVRDEPAPDANDPGHGLPGIRTTDDHGAEISLGPDFYSGKPTLRVEGTCMRYHGEYDYDYDEDGEPGW